MNVPETDLFLAPSSPLPRLSLARLGLRFVFPLRNGATFLLLHVRIDCLSTPYGSLALRWLVRWRGFAPAETS